MGVSLSGLIGSSQLTSILDAGSPDVVQTWLSTSPPPTPAPVGPPPNRTCADPERCTSTACGTGSAWAAAGSATAPNRHAQNTAHATRLLTAPPPIENECAESLSRGCSNRKNLSYRPGRLPADPSGRTRPMESIG